MNPLDELPLELTPEGEEDKRRFLRAIALAHGPLRNAMMRKFTMRYKEVPKVR